MSKANTRKLWTSVASEDTKTKVMNLATGDFQERTPVKCLILYQSRKETQNTKKIAEHMALAIKADLMPIDRVEEININDYDIVGFGSGVYMRHLGKQLIKYVQNLPPKKQEAFIFYTSGAQVVDRARDKFSRLLQSKGRTVIGSWHCMGWDVFFTLFKKTGGFNKGKPDETDCKSASDWIIKLLGRRHEE